MRVVASQILFKDLNDVSEYYCRLDGEVYQLLSARHHNSKWQENVNIGIKEDNIQRQNSVINFALINNLTCHTDKMIYLCKMISTLKMK